MKKNNMFKIIAILSLVLALLSWVLKSPVYSSGTLMSETLNRVSLFEFVRYPIVLLLDQIVSLPLLFILSVGGLYGVLSKTGKYRNKLEKIAKSLKGKEEIFLVVVTLILAILSSICGLNLMLFIFMPAICSIIILMGYDKITAMLSTFLAPIIGLIGSTYGATMSYYINVLLNITTDTKYILFKVALFVVSYGLYIAFLLIHARKSKLKNNKNIEKEKDENDEIPFLGEKKQSKKASWPIFLIFGILLILLILGCTRWSETFNVTVFTKLHENITNWSIADHTIIAYLINGLSEFGQWDYIEMTAMTLIASVIISLVYNLKNEGIKAWTEGVLKVLKPALLVAFAYIVVMITYAHPYFTGITTWMMDLIKNISGVFGDLVFIFVASINTILSTILNIDALFVLQSSTEYMSQTSNNVLGLITQAMNGITLFVAPTSTMMLLGLEYLDISYKDWLKTIWKLVIGLLIVSLIIIIIATFI